MADQFDPEHAHRLEDPTRLEARPAAALVGLLRLGGAETVVDYGAGTGIYTVAIAAEVPRGKVFDLDILSSGLRRSGHKQKNTPWGMVPQTLGQR